jgi:PE family
MSYVLATPEMMTSAATDLATIGSDLSAADEVSASIAHLFSQYGGGFQALAGKASVFHEQFVQQLKAGAGSYASTESANVASLLQSIASLELRAVFGVGAVESPGGMEFLSNLAALPPLEAIPLLLTSPVSVPLLYLLFALGSVQP